LVSFIAPVAAIIKPIANLRSCNAHYTTNAFAAKKSVSASSLVLVVDKRHWTVNNTIAYLGLVYCFRNWFLSLQKKTLLDVLNTGKKVMNLITNYKKNREGFLLATIFEFCLHY